MSGRGRMSVAAGSASDIGRGRPWRTPRSGKPKANDKTNSSSASSTSEGVLVPNCESFTVIKTNFQNTASIINNVLESPTDLDLICDGGVVSVHRIFLMCISKFMRNLLLEWDIKDTPNVTLGFVSLHHMKMVRELVYDGVTKIVGESDRRTLDEVLKLLGVDGIVMEKIKKITPEEDSGGPSFSGISEPQKEQVEKVDLKTEDSEDEGFVHTEGESHNNEEEEKRIDAIVREAEKHPSDYEDSQDEESESSCEENENENKKAAAVISIISNDDWDDRRHVSIPADDNDNLKEETVTRNEEDGGNSVYEDVSGASDVQPHVEELAPDTDFVGDANELENETNGEESQNDIGKGSGSGTGTGTEIEENENKTIDDVGVNGKDESLDISEGGGGSQDEEKENLSGVDSVVLKDSDDNEQSLLHNTRNNTNCICGYRHDDAQLIRCDQCNVWQHKDCMEIPRTDTPVPYLCEICKPREVKRSRAQNLQAFNIQVGIINANECNTKNTKIDISTGFDDAGGDSSGDTLDSQVNSPGNRKRSRKQQNNDAEMPLSSQILRQKMKRPKRELSTTTTSPEPIEPSKVMARKQQPRNSNGRYMKMPVKNEEFRCPLHGCYCNGKVFNSKLALHVHGENAVKCSKCDQWFSNQSYLDRHVKRIHGEIPSGQSTRTGRRK